MTDRQQPPTDGEAPDLRTPAVAQVLDGADDLAVTVLAKAGPHTTPELFTVAFGRVWCLTAATTLKAKLLQGGGTVAFLATHGSRSVIGLGSASVVDLNSPMQNLRTLRASVTAPAAVGRFVVENAAELSGALLDLFAGRLGSPLPPRRVALCLEPRAMAVLDDSREVAEAGGWIRRGEVQDRADAAAPELDVLDGVPGEVRDLAQSGPAALGWTTSAGDPLCLPGHWSAESGDLTVPSRLFELTGAARSSAASITRDKWTGFGPSGKQGLMLRGTGTASEAGGDTRIAVDVTGVAYWDGVETGSVSDGRS